MVRHLRLLQAAEHHPAALYSHHIENPNLLATKIIVPHKLIPRESCCPPEEQR